MSYSEDNISAQPADAEYSARSRRRAQAREDAVPTGDASDMRRRRNPAVPLPRACAEETPDESTEAAPVAAEDDAPARPVRRPRAERALRRRAQEDLTNDEARAESDDDYDGRNDVVRRPRRAREQPKRREPVEDYRDEPEDYVDERPRNRFMAWLESLRIVEEIPEGEEDEDYADEDCDNVAAGHARERRAAGGRRDSGRREDSDGHAGVPLPAGRQRRGEIAEYTEDAADEADSGSEHAERPAVRGAYGRRTQSGAAVRSAQVQDETEAVSDTEEAGAEQYAAEDEAVAADACADEQLAKAQAAVEPEDCSDEHAAEASVGSMPDEIIDGDMPISRRARRAGVATEVHAGAAGEETIAAAADDAHDVETVEPEQVEPAEVEPEDEGETLEQHYINASIEEKRRILFEHWQEQFVANLVIPAKPEKLKAITGTVSQILNACPDEYALGERWEKIEELLENYSSAVVAEYGYRSLLAAVQAEEKQRMFGRPTETPERTAPQMPRLAGKAAATARSEARSAAAVHTEDVQSQDCEPAAAKGEGGKRDYDMNYGAEERDYGADERTYGDTGRRQRARRGYSGEFDYEPERRRAGGLSRLISKVKEFGNRDRNEEDYGESDGQYDAPRGSRLKQIFRKGDVLDYSSDESEQAEESDFDDFGDPAESAPTAVRANYYARPAGAERSASASNDNDAGRQYAVERPREYGDYANDSYVREDAGHVREDDAYVRNDGGYARRDGGYARESGDYAREDDAYFRDSDARSGDAYSRNYDYPPDDRAERQEDGDYREQAEEQPYVVDRAIYDERNADYSADRPDYSQDYADDDDYSRSYAGGYSQSAYSGEGYARADAYQYGRSQYARPNPVSRPEQREYGERSYHTRPQGGTTEQTGEDSEDRWRRCSPTKDDRGGMGAPQGDTCEEHGRACARTAMRAARGMLSVLERIVFTAALADDGVNDENDGGQYDPAGEDRKSADPSIDEQGAEAMPDGGARYNGSRRRIRPGARFNNTARGYLAMVGTLALMAVLGGGAYVSRVVYDVRQHETTFYPGIYLDDTELTGMSLDEAEREINALNAARRAAMRLTVKYGDEAYDIDSDGLNVRLDTRARLEELWQLGRDGGYAARHAQITRLKAENVRKYTSLSYSEDALDEFLGGIKESVDKKPRDAEIKFRPNESEKFSISESSSGREVDINALTADARAALSEGTDSIELAPKRLEPSFTTADARACTGRLVTYSTTIHSSNPSRTANIKLALGFYHGLRVEPGQQVDFNKLVGNRTKARGFKPAPEYSNGEIVEGVGGGVCQASTTLYGALLRAGMRIDERYNHSMTVGYVPKSQDAAVVYPGKTLTFTNTTGYPAFFTARVTSEKATVTIYGYDIYPGKTVKVESEILAVDEAKITTYADPTYQYTSEPGQVVTVTTPSDGVTSRAYLVLTDDKTGKVVSRESLGKDTYRRRDGVRYRGGE